MKKEQLLGLLFGGVVGDALGVPVEFLDRGTYLKNDIANRFIQKFVSE